MHLQDINFSKCFEVCEYAVFRQHGTGAFATANSQDPDAASAAAQEEVFLRFIFFFNEAQVLTHATHLLSKAHIAYKVGFVGCPTVQNAARANAIGEKHLFVHFELRVEHRVPCVTQLVGGYRNCPILACELADAMFDGHRMVTARQLYFTLATAFASYKSGHQKSWQLEVVPALCHTASPVTSHQAADLQGQEKLRNEEVVTLPETTDISTGNSELSSAPQDTASVRQSENLSRTVADEPLLPAGSRLRLSGTGNCTG